MDHLGEAVLWKAKAMYHRSLAGTWFVLVAGGAKQQGKLHVRRKRKLLCTSPQIQNPVPKRKYLPIYRGWSRIA